MSEARGSSPTSPHEQAARGEFPVAAPALAQLQAAASPSGGEQESAQQSPVMPSGLSVLGRPMLFAPIEPQARAQPQPSILSLGNPLFRSEGVRSLSSIVEESSSPSARASEQLMEEARSARWQRMQIPSSLAAAYARRGSQPATESRRLQTTDDCRALVFALC